MTDNEIKLAARKIITAFANSDKRYNPDDVIKIGKQVVSIMTQAKDSYLKVKAKVSPV